MRTAEKYKEMGFIELLDTKVQDRYGDIYYPKKAKSPLQAIKFFCRECMGMDRTKKKRLENVELVRDCSDPMCPLFDFRLGKNPFMKRIWTDEQRKVAQDRAALAFGHAKKPREDDEAVQEPPDA